MNLSFLVSRLVRGARRGTHIASHAVAGALASLGIVGLVLTSACYAYDVRAPGDLTAGQHVVATVNNAGRVALAADLGEDVRQVEGDLASVTDTALRVRVSHIEYVSGKSSPFPGGEVVIPRNTITTLNTKQFSRSRTAAVAVGLTAAFVAAITALGLGGLGGTSSEPKPGGPPASQ